jgi:hypothetical protein
MTFRFVVILFHYLCLSCLYYYNSKNGFLLFLLQPPQPVMIVVTVIFVVVAETTVPITIGGPIQSFLSMIQEAKAHLAAAALVSELFILIASVPSRRNPK